MKHFLPTALIIAACAALSANAAETWSYADCVDYARTHKISLQKSRLAEETA